MAISQTSTSRHSGSLLPFLRTAAVGAGSAQMRAHHRNDVIVVTIEGEIDATNVQRVADYIREFLPVARHLILDLKKIEFLCATGGLMLVELHTECYETGLTWGLVTSPAVDRLLRIVPTGAPLPVSDTLPGALGVIGNIKLA